MKAKGKRYLLVTGTLEIIIGLVCILWIIGLLMTKNNVALTQNEAVRALGGLLILYAIYGLHILGGLLGVIFADRPKHSILLMIFGFLLILMQIYSWTKVEMDPTEMVISAIFILIPCYYFYGAALNYQSRNEKVAKPRKIAPQSASVKTASSKPVRKPATTKKVATKKATPAKRVAATKKTTTKKAPAKKTTTTKVASAKKATTAKKVAAKPKTTKASAKKTTTTKKAAAKKTATTKKVATKKATPAKRVAATKKTTTKKAPAKKTTTTKKVTKKATPKKTTTRRTTTKKK